MHYSSHQDNSPGFHFIFHNHTMNSRQKYLILQLIPFKVHTLHDFMFSEKKMKKLMKSIEDSFEYTQRSDEFEQIHNMPEKMMKDADSIGAEI